MSESAEAHACPLVQGGTSQMCATNLRSVLGHAARRIRRGLALDTLRLLEDAEHALAGVVDALRREPRASAANAAETRMDLRRCAIVGRLLTAAVDVLQSPVPVAAAWHTCTQFLVAAQAVVDDLTPLSPTPRPVLRLISL